MTPKSGLVERGMTKLTLGQRELLATLAMRPNGAPIRGIAEKQIVLELADLLLVCDPHTMGDALFTRITPAGRALLSALPGDTKL